MTPRSDEPSIKPGKVFCHANGCTNYATYILTKHYTASDTYSDFRCCDEHIPPPDLVDKYVKTARELGVTIEIGWTALEKEKKDCPQAE